MRVLVTGATGLIGRRVIPLLIARGIDVIALTRAPQPAETAGVVFEQGDMFEPARVSEIISRHRPTHLLHLAWITEPTVYWTSPDNSRWAATSAQLFERFVAAGGERVVVAGSCAEYDWTAGTFDEVEEPHPSTPYGRAKDDARATLAALANRSDVSWAWGRIFFVYGPGESAERFVPSLANALLAGQLATCRKPSLIRDWMYVDDAAAAFVALLTAPIEGAVNVASGVGTTLRALAERIGATTGHLDCLAFGDDGPSITEPGSIVATRGRLSAYWKPAVNLDEGIARTVAWLREARATGTIPSTLR